MVTISRALRLAAAAAMALIFNASLLAGEPRANANTVVYKPPPRGTPNTRMGGSARGLGGEDTLVRVLAPDHTGWAASDSPTLYWFLSRPARTRVELTLTDEVAVQPLLETDVPGLAGIQSLDLNARGIHLKPGVEYRWSVALVTDEDQRSKDGVASGTLAYEPPPPDLRRRLDSISSQARYVAFAESGYWYDAFDALSRLIARNPNNTTLHQPRAQLLEQISLPEVAKADSR